MDEIMLLTTDDLRAKHTMIHYFGLGFIQIKMGEWWRFHFYNEAVPSIMPEEEVHNHRYDFSSEIISGGLSEELYVPADGDDHCLTSVSCDPDNKAPDDQRLCGLKLIHTQYYTGGATYWTDQDTFHRVKAGYCITRLRRGNVAKDFAQVIRPVKEQEVCPFSPEMSEDDMWDIVDDMCKSIGKVEV